jgi:hypothetical protein
VSGADPGERGGVVRGELCAGQTFHVLGYPRSVTK